MIDQRPPLNKVPIPYPPRGGAVITMSIGQWDGVLAAAYETGWFLLELDDNERPVACYQKRATTPGGAR